MRRAPKSAAAGLTTGLLFIIAVLGCRESRASVSLHFETAGIKNSPEIRAELALTEGERNLGLMYRKQLGAAEGMLFIFPDEQPRSFWMKNTYIELDMIYLDSSLTVVSIVHRAVPLSEASRPSGAPARYVLEVNGGSAQKWGIREGSRLIPKEQLPAGH